MKKVKYVSCHYAYDNSAKGIIEHIQYLRSIGCEIFDIELMNDPSGKITIPRYIVAEEWDGERWDWCNEGDIIYGFNRDDAYSINRPDEKVSYERWCNFKASERKAGRDVGTFLGDPFE